MPDKPEQLARKTIDELLSAADWQVQDRKRANFTAGRGVAIREFPLSSGHGFADYLLYLDGAAAGVVEAKKDGVALTGMELQTWRYSVGLPEDLPAPRRPLPFLYQATSKETRFTNLLEPDTASGPVFAFHKPETLADWLMKELHSPGSTTKARIRRMPPLIPTNLLPAQVKAIQGLETSLADGRAHSSPTDLSASAAFWSGKSKTRGACVCRRGTVLLDVRQRQTGFWLGTKLQNGRRRLAQPVKTPLRANQEPTF